MLHKNHSPSFTTSFPGTGLVRKKKLCSDRFPPLISVIHPRYYENLFVPKIVAVQCKAGNHGFRAKVLDSSVPSTLYRPFMRFVAHMLDTNALDVYNLPRMSDKLRKMLQYEPVFLSIDTLVVLKS